MNALAHYALNELPRTVAYDSGKCVYGTGVSVLERQRLELRLTPGDGDPAATFNGTNQNVTLPHFRLR